MAEFCDVIYEMNRMCTHFSPTCNGCKLCMGKGTDKFCGEEPKDIRSDPALVEAAVMQWAAEHPEPVYPTWYEFMLENKIIPDVLEDCGDYYKTIGKWLVKATIKHDIAQKLDVEPKEGA